jgi:hypothetical protein
MDGGGMVTRGAVQFERGEHGKVNIVLLVHGEAVARSESPTSIAAEIAFRDISSLAFSDSFVVPIPTNADALVMAAQAAHATPEIFTAYRLISECAW